MDYNENEYFILINTGIRPSLDYGFEIKGVNVVKENPNNKEATLVINSIKTNDQYRLDTQQVDTRTIGIIKIDRNKLPKDIILNGVSIGLENYVRVLNIKGESVFCLIHLLSSVFKKSITLVTHCFEVSNSRCRW